MRNKAQNGEGSVRKLTDGKYECVMVAKYPNPKTGNAKRIKRRGSTKEEAQKNALLAKRAWEKEIERGKNTKIPKGKTFGEYMSEFIDNEIKPNITQSAYLTYCSNMKVNFYPFPIANYQLHMLTSAEFENYYNSILEKKSRKTCVLPIQLCRRCCEYLVNKSLLYENYAKIARVPREVADEYDYKREQELKNLKEVFTAEDIQKFYYAYKQNISEYPVVILFLLETGMRESEFASLRNSNIDLEHNIINIVETRSTRFINNEKNNGIEEYVKVPKNGESRFIVMSDLCRECVEYMQEQTKLHCLNNPDDLLYPTFRNGKRRSNATMRVGFNLVCDKMGIDRDVHLTKTGKMKGLSINSLRHTAISIANSQVNANIVNTALKVGHKAINTENIYTHATKDGISSVTTPSQAVLDDYKNNLSCDKEKELYELYLKLKDKFKE